MDMIDQAPASGLAQAAQQRDVPGALQQLLLSRIHTPEQMQQLDQRRASALGAYQDALRAPAQGNYTPLEQALYTWIGNLPGPGAVYRGIAAGGAQMAANEAARVKGDMLAEKVGYEDAKDQAKLDMSELAAIKGLAAGKNSGKFIQFKDDKGNLYVMNNATGEKQVIPASGAPLWQKAYLASYNKATEENQPDPEGYAVSSANRATGSSPAGFASSDTRQPPTAPVGEQGIPRSAPTAPGNPTALAPAQNVPLTYLDRVDQARLKEMEIESEKAGVKEYNEEIVPAAKAAENTLNNLSAIRQIAITPGALAPLKEKVGSWMEALGMDNSLVRQAQGIQEIRPILSKIANDRLLLAKGIQTEGDAQRAFNEFMQITDTQKAIDFMLAWSQELANRSKTKQDVYDVAKQETKSRQHGSKYWGMTDYSQAAPVAILNGRPWTFTEWRDKFIKANPDAMDQDKTLAIKEWNKLARRI